MKYYEIMDKEEDKMDKFVEDYKKIDKEVRRKISSDMIKVMGLENLLYGIVHAMVCDCIDKDIPGNERRKAILDRVNVELNKWIE